MNLLSKTLLLYFAINLTSCITKKDDIIGDSFIKASVSNFNPVNSNSNIVSIEDKFKFEDTSSVFIDSTEFLAERELEQIYHHSKHLNKSLETYVVLNKQNFILEFESISKMPLGDVNIKFDWAYGYMMVSDFATNSIIIDSSESIYNGLSTTEDFKETDYYGVSTVKGSLIHEFGHILTSKIVSKLYEDDSLNKFFSERYSAFLDNPDSSFGTFNDHLLETILFEGIAEYFSITSGEHTFLEYFNPSIMQYESSEYFAYMGGYLLIKPIFDELGVETGLTRMLSKPMLTFDELEKPDLYHKRIIRGK